MYRLLMRWVYKNLYPLVSPHLHPRQFESKRGVPTTHATQAFLNDMDAGTLRRLFMPSMCSTPFTAPLGYSSVLSSLKCAPKPNYCA